MKFVDLSCPFLLLGSFSVLATDVPSLPRKTSTNALFDQGKNEKNWHQNLELGEGYPTSRNLAEGTNWAVKVTSDIEDYFKKNCPCEVFKKFNTRKLGSVQKLDINEMVALFIDIAQTQNEPGSSSDWSQNGNAAYWAVQWMKEKMWTEDDMKCAKCVEDPRFHRFTGNIFYFHGLCDLLLFKNENYNSGAGLDVHIRTDHKISPATGETAAFIAQAAVKIGYDILEVHNDGSYYVNGNENVSLPTSMSGGTYKVEKHEYEVCFGPNKDKRCTQEILFDISSASADAGGLDCFPAGSTGNTSRFCPVREGGDLCFTVIQPVTCITIIDDDIAIYCEYNNECEAIQAGFKPEECLEQCTETCNPIVETDSTGSCPPKDENTICPEIFSPVTCGLSNSDPESYVLCDYANQCEALSAGFDAMSCAGKCEVEVFDIDKSRLKNDHIYIKVHHDMVHVELKLVPDSVSGGKGLLSDTKQRLARDGITVLNDPKAFGQEWQVNPIEDGGSLFQTTIAPQYPEQCVLPTTHEIARLRQLRQAAKH